MRIAIVGTGYVGLVTGVCLSEAGHEVTCIDVDPSKVEKMKAGISPIYEPGLEELMKKNIEEGRLFFTTAHEEGFLNAEAIYIAVGTPPRADGTANLTYVEEVARSIAQHIRSYVVVVTKSTVPVGTNRRIKEMIAQGLKGRVSFDVVSNPEFLREGTAVHDAFKGDRIVIGSDSKRAAALIEEINAPFGIPIYHTDISSAEMIKYASNAFLATKISFINEISALCEKLGANVEDVAQGMGMDQRIGGQFLRAGIGYGGSCFPKDTKALVQIAGNVEHEFDLLKSVIQVNNKQQRLLVDKARSRFGALEGKTVALLGLAFKPHTDDMRESASIVISEQLLAEGAMVKAYDPIAGASAKQLLPGAVELATSLEEALNGADCVFIVTDWPEFKQMELDRVRTLLKQPVIFDGRNCFSLDHAAQHGVEYHSIGRASVYPG
ncbi:MAG: UDP-glucose 6-dehydrogenase ywqF [Paenibacillaceae bacterium]|jgi:UDPglucose 6-dehydrogenase|nr:UDP-glucose 6-dehydrogenase ywqF [Paenibacillaceae bacterium]